MENFIIKQIIQDYLRENLELNTNYNDSNNIEIQLLLEGEKIGSVYINLD